MAVTKGVSFVNTRSFLEERFGAGTWARVLATMSAADREMLETVLAVGWYDLALYARLLRALDTTCGSRDLQLLRALGRYEAERDLSTFHRLFFRLANPAYAVEKTAEYWRRFHDTGTWNVQRKSPTFVTGTLDRWGVVDHALCVELTGYMPRVIELVGGKSARMFHPQCRAKGAATCYFELTWDD